MKYGRRHENRTRYSIILILIYALLTLTSCQTNFSSANKDNMDVHESKNSNVISDQVNNSLFIYFNSPLDYDEPQQTTESNIGKALIELIDSSTISIDFALYGLRGQPEVINAIEKAIARGVKVRGVVDKDIHDVNYYSDTPELINLVGGIITDYQTDINTLNMQSDYIVNPYWPSPIGFEGPPQMVGYSLVNNKAIIAVHASRENIKFEGDIMHNKFFIIDSKKVWTGSTNVSDTGTGGYNANIACVIENEAIAELYLNEFSQMYDDELFHKNKKKNPDSKKITLDDGTVIETYFSPQDSAISSAICPLISGAKESINMPVFYLTDKQITAELIKAYNRGIDIRVIIDATSAQNGYTKHEILRAVGIPVKVENWGGKMHMKSIVVDDEYVVGSMNFTSAGTNSNDENLMVIRNSYYTQEATEFFDLMWDSIPNEFAHKNPQPESYESVNSMFDGVDNDFDNLVDNKDEGNLTETELPPYLIVPKKDGYNLIKGVENKNGFMIYILPNSEYYSSYIVNQKNEFYFPSVQESLEAGFVAFNYKKHIMME